MRSIPKSEFPVEFSECAALFYYKLGAPMSEPSDALFEVTHLTINRFLVQNTAVSMTFRNGFDFPINFFWEDEAISSSLQGHLEPGEAAEMTTRLVQS